MPETQPPEPGACCACQTGPVESHPHFPAPCLRNAEVVAENGEAYCWLCHNANAPKARLKRGPRGPQGSPAYRRRAG